MNVAEPMYGRLFSSGPHPSNEPFVVSSLIHTGSAELLDVGRRVFSRTPLSPVLDQAHAVAAQTYLGDINIPTAPHIVEAMNRAIADGYTGYCPGPGIPQLREALADDLDNAWEVLAEPIQTVMRRFGLPQPYEQLKKFTRGQAMTRELMQGFIAGLPLPQEEKERLLALTPAAYLGKAAELARRA